MANDPFAHALLTRRIFGATLAGGAALAFVPGSAYALDVDSARAVATWPVGRQSTRMPVVS